ncbi:hypothetical protein SF83666_b58450 (plasmid) [Sinorhizobium fredii CCBAU 83666]|nr:hypothetical protein SF83666_b58450 [Sinorhizobium fredii CCBAU 83666]
MPLTETSPTAKLDRDNACLLRARQTGCRSAGIAGAGSASTTSTGTSCGADGAEIWQSSLRQRKRWLTWMPAE